MKTIHRNNIVARQKRTMRAILAWAISSSISLIIVTILCGYAFLSRPIKLIPMCGSEVVISDTSYSPEYLLESAKKIAHLRLTFNPETVSSQYAKLLNFTDLKHQASIKNYLNKEIKTVQHKAISSVFYINKVKVDITKNKAVLTGELDRSSHGIALKPEQKQYEIQFSFNGTLQLKSIKELKHG